MFSLYRFSFFAKQLVHSEQKVASRDSRQDARKRIRFTLLNVTVSDHASGSPDQTIVPYQSLPLQFVFIKSKTTQNTSNTSNTKHDESNCTHDPSRYFVRNSCCVTEKAIQDPTIQPSALRQCGASLAAKAFCCRQDSIILRTLN